MRIVLAWTIACSLLVGAIELQAETSVVVCEAGTDISNELQAGLDSSSALGGGTLILPEGTFLVETYITQVSNIDVIGADTDKTLLYSSDRFSSAPVGGLANIRTSNLRVELEEYDPDNDGLTYSVSNTPAGLALVGSVFRSTPTEQPIEIYSDITFEVKDGEDTTLEPAQIHVLAEPPILDLPDVVDGSIAGYDGHIPTHGIPAIHVLNNGIVADGVTDNTPAILTLIDNASAPSVLSFPSGTYAFSSGFDLKPGINLRVDTGTQGGNNIDLELICDSWIRNVESESAQRHHVTHSRALQVVVLDSWFHHFKYGGFTPAKAKKEAGTTGATDTAAPTAPSSISVNQIHWNTFTFSWLVAVDADSGINLHDTNQLSAPIVITTYTSCALTDLAPGTSHIAVAALNPFGLSSWLEVDTVAHTVVPDVNPPDVDRLFLAPADTLFNGTFQTDEPAWKSLEDSSQTTSPV